MTMVYYYNTRISTMRAQRSTDSNFVIRAFFVHCFIHIYQMLRAVDPTQVFRPPRFQLFQKIRRKFTKGTNSLFKNILTTFRWHIIRGGVMTCIFVFFNLLVPQLIKMFMHFMHGGGHSQGHQVTEASGFIRNLVGVQILRIMFGQHTRRIFHELAIKVQSSLAKMLVQKSLNLTQKARKDIPQSQIMQLQNVDLKLVFTMMNNMMFLFQAPLTIIVALIMLFVQNRTYGFIGMYWFLIAFLLHRQLDQKMTHCNATKLGLIDKRSKANYQMLFGMKQAKMIGWQDVMIEKNNDLFQVENHDHYLFYFYNSLYDIILLMLPVLVVVSICVVDVGEANPISVEQVYLMLSLLGICYQPMKQFRTISISFHDGLHSLNRIQQYFDMPEQKKDTKFINNQISEGHLVIQKDTAATFPGTIFDFYVKTKFQIELAPGDRFVILGRKGQGRTAFLNMINGFMQRIQGQIRINGRRASLGESFFFIKSTVRQNISFYNQIVSQQEIDKVCQQLEITEQTKKFGGLNAVMEDINLYSKSLLQRISLARVICSGAQIYLLDRPVQDLQPRFQIRVQKMFRNKQQNFKVLIIMSKGQIIFGEDADKVGIISNGNIQQYGTYGELVSNPNSQIKNYFRSKQDKQMLMSPLRKQIGPAIMKNKLKQAVRKVTAFNKAVKGLGSLMSLTSIKSIKSEDQQKQKQQQMKKSMTPAKIDSLMTKLHDNKQMVVIEQKQKSKKQTLKHLKRFVFAVPIVEILFIMVIIACAQLLHVFIHYWIGHLQQQHGDNSYLNFRSMIAIQVILTLGLAVVLYYQGQVSSQIAIIQGNQMYNKSLFSLIKRRVSYFVSEYPVKIADRFNHDYQQVFIACHGLLTIYKNIVMLIVTVVFISSDGFTVLIFFAVIIFLYASIYFMFRKVENKIISHYYDYKYGFVKCFQESLQGSEYFSVYDSKNFLIRRAQRKYRRLASYKLAEKYTNHGLSIACDIMGNILLATIVYYGLEMKIHHTRANIALIATSIHLLMNGSQVLKNILKQTINFQTFFNINLIPSIQIIDEKLQKQQKVGRYEKPDGHQIKFESVTLSQPGQMRSHSISLKIRQGEHVLLYEVNQSFRNLLLYALTQNLQIYQNNKNKKSNQPGTLQIGNANVQGMDPQQILKLVGVILNKNFYFTGTLRDNLVRKIKVDQQQVDQYIKLLRIDEDLDDYDLKGLETKIYCENTKINFELTKKFALLRILLYRSKIVIIKDTTAFIGTLSIVDIVRKYIPECTIIKINGKPEAAFGVDRIVHFQNSVCLQDGSPQQLMSKPTSIMGNMLKDLNMQDYLFKQQVSNARIGNRFKKKRH